jgi:hypothetical protein
MRFSLFALAAATTLSLGAPAFSQPMTPAEPPAVAVPMETHPGSARCDELRKACLDKDELGERGEGNCKWYRENCR